MGLKKHTQNLMQINTAATIWAFEKVLINVSSISNGKVAEQLF